MAKKNVTSFPNKGFPTDVEIRAALLKRARDYCAEKGIGITSLAKSAVNDLGFFARVENGGNFTIGSYRKCMDYMNSNAAADKKPKRKSA